MIVKQAILTVLLASSHSNAKDGARFRDAKPNVSINELNNVGV